MQAISAHLPQSLLSFPDYLAYHLRSHLDLVSSGKGLYAIAQHVISHPQQALSPLIHDPLKIVHLVQSYYANAEDPVWTVMPLFWTSMVGSYVVGLLTNNVSQIDRQWTFLPVLYSAHFALYPLYADTSAAKAYEPNMHRAIVMLGLQVLWSMRLSYNTFRRGLFGFFEEDYRWEIWRKLVPRWFFELFHLGFIAIAQSILLLMIALPVHHVLVLPTSEARPFPSTIDLLLISLTSLTLYTQWSADNQQQSFQTYKYALKDKAEKDKTPLETTSDAGLPQSTRNWSMELGLESITWTPIDAARGFVVRGLWSWSRHPNFACEQTFWLLQGLFAVFAAEGPLSAATKEKMLLSHPLIAPLALSMLFVASTQFTESITGGKYSSYKAYQVVVGEFAPQATLIKGVGLRLLGRRKEFVDKVWTSGKQKRQ